MTEFVLSSRNAGKIAELKTLLSEYITKPFKLLSLDDIGYTEDTEENGTTFEENSVIKASVPAKYGFIGIGDDSGLSVDALCGAPGIYSARYSGDGANTERNNSKLLNELEKFPNYEDRKAHFICAASCVYPNGGKKVTFTGICDGVILPEPAGNGGFGYDPLFYYEPFNKTFGELTAEEKNRVSHRSIAMRQLALWLSDNI